MNISVQPGYNLAIIKVLVVEDNKNMQNLLTAILTALGVCQMISVFTGAEAFEELARYDADMVICDWNMESMNGFEFTRNIRNHPKSPNPYVPIIMLTGHTEVERVKQARDAGVNLFVAKPVSVKLLSERIVDLIDHLRPFIRAKEFSDRTGGARTGSVLAAARTGARWPRPESAPSPR